jgi:hypothetical protein
LFDPQSKRTHNSVVLLCCLLLGLSLSAGAIKREAPHHCSLALIPLASGAGHGTCNLLGQGMLHTTVAVRSHRGAVRAYERERIYLARATAPSGLMNYSTVEPFCVKRTFVQNHTLSVLKCLSHLFFYINFDYLFY